MVQRAPERAPTEAPPVTSEETLPDGSTRTTFADGTVSVSQPNGDGVSNYPNGSRVEVRNGVRREYDSAGTLVNEENQSGPTTAEQQWLQQGALTYASRHPKVRELHVLLNERGAAPPVPLDQQFTQLTLTAVKDFQGQNGLKPDGIVGGDTWAALGGTPPLPSIKEQGPGNS